VSKQWQVRAELSQPGIENSSRELVRSVNRMETSDFVLMIIQQRRHGTRQAIPLRLIPQWHNSTELQAKQLTLRTQAQSFALISPLTFSTLIPQTHPRASTAQPNTTPRNNAFHVLNISLPPTPPTYLLTRQTLPRPRIRAPSCSNLPPKPPTTRRRRLLCRNRPRNPPGSKSLHLLRQRLFNPMRQHNNPLPPHARLPARRLPPQSRPHSAHSA
jgi:hypothetical protein